MRLNLPVLLDGLLDGSGVRDALLGPRPTVLAIRADPNVGLTPETLMANADQSLATDHALPARRVANHASSGHLNAATGPREERQSRRECCVDDKVGANSPCVAGFCATPQRGTAPWPGDNAPRVARSRSRAATSVTSSRSRALRCASSSLPVSRDAGAGPARRRATRGRKLGRSTEAIADLTAAISLSPPYPEPYYNRGDLLMELGEHERAVDDFAYVLELDPTFVDAYVNLVPGQAMFARSRTLRRRRSWGLRLRQAM